MNSTRSGLGPPISGTAAVARLAPLSGLVFVVLFAAGSAVWGFDQPPRNATTDELVSFYTESSTEILIGGTMSLVSVPFLVWFGAVLRDRLAQAEGSERSGLPLVAFAGTLLAVGVGLGAETINMAGALSADDGQLTGDTAQVYFDVSYALGAPAAGVAFALAAVPTAVIALRTGRLLPAWAAWLAVLTAVAMLTPLMLTPAYSVMYVLVLVFAAGLSVRLFRLRELEATK